MKILKVIKMSNILKVCKMINMIKVLNMQGYSIKVSKASISNTQGLLTLSDSRG